MLMQGLLIFLLFAVAVAYLSYRAYRNFSKSEAGCGKGCGCATDAKMILPVRAKQTTNRVG